MAVSSVLCAWVPCGPVDRATDGGQDGVGTCLYTSCLVVLSLVAVDGLVVSPGKVLYQRLGASFDFFL